MKTALSRYSAVATGALLFVVSVCLAPYAFNGFWGDDTLNSVVWGEINRSGMSLPAFSWRVAMEWLYNDGRFIPLGLFQTYSVFYWLQEPHVYRAAQLLFLGIHIGLFAWLLRLLRLPWRFIGLWVLGLVAAFQIRDFHDPIESYAFLMQLHGIFFTLALLMIVKWNESPQPRWLVLSAALLVTSILFYELNFIGFPIAVALVCASKQAGKLKATATLFLVAMLMCALLAEIYARTYATNSSYTGTQFGATNLMFETYIKQWIAALPGSFYAFRYGGAFSPSQLMTAFCSNPVAWLLFVAAAYAAWYCSGAPSSTRQQSRTRELAVLAFSLVFLPPVFAAVSEKYQKELIWGWGYLHVYYSYFGVALCAAAFLTWIARGGTRTKVVLAMALAILITANWLVNRSISAQQDLVFSVKLREALASALKNGLLDQVRDGDFLMLENMPFFINSSFIYQYSRKRVVLEGVSDTAYLPKQAPSDKPRRYKIEQRYERSRGWEIALIDPLGPRYEASLADGIDFGRPGYPTFIREVDGVSGHEAWGRWSDGSKVVFEFEEPLPTTLTLVIDLFRAFGPNAGQPVRVRIGDAEGSFTMNPDEPLTVRLPFVLQEATDTIEIFISNPVSPQEISQGQNSDRRKVGIGFVKLSVLSSSGT